MLKHGFGAGGKRLDCHACKEPDHAESEDAMSFGRQNCKDQKNKKSGKREQGGKRIKQAARYGHIMIKVKPPRMGISQEADIKKNNSALGQ